MILNTKVLRVAVSPDEVAAAHVGVNIGDAGAGDKLQLAGQGRLYGPRAHWDKKHFDIQTIFTRQVPFLHDVNRIKLNAYGGIGGAHLR